MAQFSLVILGKQYLSTVEGLDAPNVVNRVRFQVTGTEGRISVTKIAVAELPLPTPDALGTFQPIETLTNHDLERFVRYAVDVSSIENEIMEDIIRRRAHIQQDDNDVSFVADPDKPPALF